MASLALALLLQNAGGPSLWSTNTAVVMPVTFDPAYMLYRMISPIPFSVFIILMFAVREGGRGWSRFIRSQHE